MLRKFTREREQSIRSTRDSAVISRLKTPTGSFCSMATCSAMFIASEVFPMLGRAAMTIISPPCRPVVILSSSMKPVEMPVSIPWCLWKSSMVLIALWTRSLMLWLVTSTRSSLIRSTSRSTSSKSASTSPSCWKTRTTTSEQV